MRAAIKKARKKEKRRHIKVFKCDQTYTKAESQNEAAHKDRLFAEKCLKYEAQLHYLFHY